MSNSNGNGSVWGTKQKILLSFGLTLIAGEFIAVTMLGKPFHFEFLLAGLACCGVAITQVGDKR